MAKIFLDANYFIGLASRVPEVETEILDEHQGFVSTLSCHILFYINKLNVPYEKMNSFIRDFNLINLSQDILERALIGPTDDLEDNIQLHSASEVECDYFLTLDKKLLNMKFHGKIKIASTLPNSES